MSEYPDIEPNRLSGSEPFHISNDPTAVSVLNFWQWSASNLGANNLRGHLAEFLVATDLGLAHNTRQEWDTCDIWTPGGYRIEVKSASYIQQWHQENLSKITFGIAPTRGWDEENMCRTDTLQRNSDVYVFCLLATQDQSKFDPTDLSQWQFYIVATKILDTELGSQKTLSLSTLQSIQHSECGFGSIKQSICKTLSASTL